jgi:hypothetical protein
MSFRLSRQRYAHNNCLYVEIAVGSKNTSEDILPVRYAKYGEGKNLVDPRDAVRLAQSIHQRWNLDYQDETKKLSIVGLANKEGKAVRHVFNFDAKDMAQVQAWAETTFKQMEKCSSCQRPIGSARKPIESADLPAKCFCSEVCYANIYRQMFGKEAPNLSPKSPFKRKI